MPKKTTFGPHTEALEEGRQFQQADRDRAALRKMRKADAWTLLETRGSRPVSIDYRGISNENELRWLRLGGSLESFAAIFAGDDDDAQALALEDLRGALGAPQSAEPVTATAFTHYKFSHDVGPPAGSAQSRLDVLHAQFDELTRRRDALGQQILAMRRRVDLEHGRRTV